MLVAAGIRAAAVEKITFVSTIWWKAMSKVSFSSRLLSRQASIRFSEPPGQYGPVSCRSGGSGDSELYLLSFLRRCLVSPWAVLLWSSFLIQGDIGYAGSLEYGSPEETTGRM